MTTMMITMTTIMMMMKITMMTMIMTIEEEVQEEMAINREIIREDSLQMAEAPVVHQVQDQEDQVPVAEEVRVRDHHLQDVAVAHLQAEEDPEEIPVRDQEDQAAEIPEDPVIQTAADHLPVTEVEVPEAQIPVQDQGQELQEEVLLQ